MSSPYLPTWATAQEASEWLHAETGQSWPLPRLLETVRKMSVWIDCRDDEPEHILEGVFQGRREGFRAPVVFGSDIARLAFVRDGGTLHITRLPDGRYLKCDPPIRFPVEELRFEADSLRRVAALSGKPVTSSNETSQAAAPAAKNKGSASLDNAPWKALANDLAIKIIERQAGKDLYPSRNDIADEIARIFRQSRPMVVGVGGKPLTGAYIKRHAFKGITSATKKAQSTRNYRGK